MGGVMTIAEQQEVLDKCIEQYLNFFNELASMPERFGELYGKETRWRNIMLSCKNNLDERYDQARFELAYIADQRDELGKRERYLHHAMVLLDGAITRISADLEDARAKLVDKEEAVFADDELLAVIERALSHEAAR